MGKRGIKPRGFTLEEIAFAKESLGRLGAAKAIELFNARFSPPIGTGLMKQLARTAGIKLHLPPGPGHSRYKPVGTERIEDHKIRGKIRRVCFEKCANGKWKNKLVVAWEEANGNIPKEHFVIALDKNPVNASLDNLLLVSRAELAAMNSVSQYFDAHVDTKIVHAIASVKVAASRLIRENTTARDLRQYKVTKNLGKFKNRRGGGDL